MGRGPATEPHRGDAGRAATGAEGARAAPAGRRTSPYDRAREAPAPPGSAPVRDTPRAPWVPRLGADAAAAVRERPWWRDLGYGATRAEANPHRVGADNIGDGRRHCGSLERVLHRQWDPAAGSPPPEVVRAVDSLAALPPALKDKLAEGLEGIYVGPGGVPELDDMAHLRGQPLPSGRATWDICAGAYGERKIIVGDRPSPTPDVMFHEVGHALDDVDGPDGGWLSDTAEFRALYEQCRRHLVSDFHRQPGDLGRREFFADAFAAIASRQRPALVDMLGGDTRTALNVMLFFNRRYGI